MDYLKLLEHSFNTENDYKENPDGNRFVFLSENIFNFTTYDSIIANLFGLKAVEVCMVINERKTFEYQKNEDNYKWFLIMCNMPFFIGKLEWGTSIRGAWWKNKTFEISSCGLWYDNEQITDPLEFNKEEWEIFIRAIKIFSFVGV